MSLLNRREPMQNKRSVTSWLPVSQDPIQKRFFVVSWRLCQREPIQKKLSMA